MSISPDDQGRARQHCGEEAFFFRHMEEGDLAAVLAIEQQAYEFPWTRGIFRDCLRIGYHCYVVTGEEGVVGYGILSIGAGESHILNLCIHPQRRRCGLGGALLRFLMEEARKARVDCILLEVRPSNEGAIRLYQSLGFNEIGLRKGYYPARKGREDALVFACEF